MKYVIVIFIVWIIFTALGYGIGMFAFNSPDLDHLAEKGVGIYGIVTGKEPENHSNIKYSYQVNGRNYQQNGSAGRGNPDFDQIQIGQKVVVYYDSENPEKAILGYPQFYSTTNRNAILQTTLFLPFFPLMITIIILLAYRNAAKNREKIETGE